jgi:hypothetical protein
MEEFFILYVTNIALTSVEIVAQKKTERSKNVRLNLPAKHPSILIFSPDGSSKPNKPGPAHQLSSTKKREQHVSLLPSSSIASPFALCPSREGTVPAREVNI